MATTKYWTGGGNDGDFSNLSNWSEATAFANSDTYVIAATNDNITAGLTHAYTGITLIVTDNFGGNIGDASGNPLSFSSVTALTYAGRGSYARFGSSGTVTTASFEHVVGLAYIATGTWTTLVNSTGRMDIAAAAVVTRLDNVSGIVTAGYNATDFTNLYNGGQCTFHRGADNVYCLKGITTQKNNGTTTYTKVDTQVQVFNGATFNKQSSGTEGGTAYVFPGGIYTVAGNQGGGATTVALNNIQIWGGSHVTTDGVPGVTFSATKTYKGTLPSSVTS